MTNPGLQTIRAKKIGLLIRDSREKTGNSVQDLGRILGVSTGTITAFETGNQSPSLPQLETLAHSLGISVEHFWGDKTLQKPIGEPIPEEKIQRFLIIRNKIIGAKLRKARLEKGQSATELAQEVGIKENSLSAYEFGEQNIPFPILENLIEQLEMELSEVIDTQGVLSAKPVLDETVRNFQKMPKEIQDFVVKPVNQPYLELAMKLSDLSADRLRGVAESILEITF